MCLYGYRDKYRVTSSTTQIILDSKKPATEVYNCPRTLVAAIDELDQSNTERNTRKMNMSYEEWKAGKTDKTVKGNYQAGAIDRSTRRGRDRADKHAEWFYKEVRKRNVSRAVSVISKKTGISAEECQRAFEHVFLDKHELDDGYDYFDPDYDMAQSWQRLITNGVKLEAHDIVLIRHKAYEAKLMRSGMSYNEAYALTNSAGHNYQAELLKFLKET